MDELARVKEHRDALDLILTARIARSVRVEQALLDHAKTNSPISPEKARTLAMELGVPDDARSPVARMDAEKENDHERTNQ